jgi:hypothetical protein
MRRVSIRSLGVERDETALIGSRSALLRVMAQSGDSPHTVTRDPGRHDAPSCRPLTCLAGGPIGLGANVSVGRVRAVTVREVAGGMSLDGRARTIEVAGVDQDCGVWPWTPSLAQPAFVNVGMNR